jgi:hypothetical protein
MAAIIKIEFLGARATKRALRRLPSIIAGRSTTKALIAASKPVIATARALSVGRGADYSKSIKGLIRRIRGEDARREQVIKIGPVSKKNPAIFSGLGHLIEFGTEPHLIEQPKLKRTIIHPGSLPFPHLRKAIDINVNIVRGTFANAMDKEVKNAARKLRRGAA